MEVTDLINLPEDKDNRQTFVNTIIKLRISSNHWTFFFSTSRRPMSSQQVCRFIVVVVWLVDWLAGWLVGWLVSWLLWCYPSLRFMSTAEKGLVMKERKRRLCTAVVSTMKEKFIIAKITSKSVI